MRRRPTVAPRAQEYCPLWSPAGGWPVDGGPVHVRRRTRCCDRHQNVRRTRRRSSPRNRAAAAERTAQPPTRSPGQPIQLGADAAIVGASACGEDEVAPRSRRPRDEESTASSRSRAPQHATPRQRERHATRLARARPTLTIAQTLTSDVSPTTTPMPCQATSASATGVCPIAVSRRPRVSATASLATSHASRSGDGDYPMPSRFASEISRATRLALTLLPK